LVNHGEVRRLLAALVKGMPKSQAAAQAVRIELTADAGVSLAANHYQVPLTSMPVEEYPALPGIFSMAADVAREDLTAALQRVTAACSTDDTLPMLTSVHMVVDHGAVRLECTDRFRLTRGHVGAVTPVGDTLDTLVPGAVLGRVVKHLTGERVQIGVGTYGATNPAISLTSGPVRVVLRTLDSDFPKLSHVIPTECTTTVVVDRKAALLAAQRCSAIRAAKYGRDGGEQIDITVDADHIRVAPNLLDDDRPGSMLVPALLAEVHGPAQRVAFRAPYLVDALDNITGNTVAIHFQGSPTRPVTFTSPNDSLSDAAAYRHVLMPIRTATTAD
jgi:DNA polymerase-3 subunit beta